MPTKKRKLPSKKDLKKTSPVKNLLYKIFGLLFLIAAFAILMTPSNLFTPKIKESPIKIDQALLSKEKSENTPVRILIPNVNIDLPIVEAPIIGGYWELSENSASYGLGSGYPDKKGNTVIFAHAREGLFYNLKDVKVGNTIYVFSKSKWFKYKVNKITTVYPNQVEVIKPTKNETLTLFTCTGFADAKRLVVTALPQK